MQAVVYLNHAVHQREHGEPMKRGLEKHGWSVRFGEHRNPVSSVDLAIVWGWRYHGLVEHAAQNRIRVLVMERGYLPDRMVWCSLGWGGLNGRAKFPRCQDRGERFEKYWPDYLRPWKSGGKYVLICGQIPGDASLNGLNPEQWASEVCGHLRVEGQRVVYRPHPIHLRRGTGYRVPPGAECSTKPNLADDLKEASLCVTFNSNSGVESVCAGVPTVVFDPGSMAWPMASHSLAEPAITPDRAAWANQLAWCQWRIEEIADGSAWEVLKCVN